MVHRENPEARAIQPLEGRLNAAAFELADEFRHLAVDRTALLPWQTRQVRVVVTEHVTGEAPIDRVEDEHSQWVVLPGTHAADDRKSVVDNLGMTEPGKHVVAQ